MHWDCYWERATSQAEREALTAAIAEANAPGPMKLEIRAGGQRFRGEARIGRRPWDDFFDHLIILCPGCRS